MQNRGAGLFVEWPDILRSIELNRTEFSSSWSRRTRTVVVGEIADFSTVIDYSFLGCMQVYSNDDIGFSWGELR